MMKLILTVLLATITSVTYGQKSQTVDLKWKIKKNEKLRYATVMSDIDTSSIKIDFGHLFNFLSDSTNNGFQNSKDFFKKFNETFRNLEYVTTLSKGEDEVVNIVMTTLQKENFKEAETDSVVGKEAEIFKMMQSMTQGVMLRGSVYETGAIHSFWLKNKQKNLIAQFFQLPTTPVKIGDKWSVDINLITNDQNFECDSAYKVNEVSLVDIKNVSGEKVAFIKYNIVEYVKGGAICLHFLEAKVGKRKP